ncbi:hypothetical protein [Halovenus salina]|uniref:Uncharacterized protein n=1 Tax=Halovenus salina TaxID=1510225 RepID=A0ABD5W1B9_9EURY|nr:hypothetical protein [Halovenus salina]
MTRRGLMLCVVLVAFLGAAGTVSGTQAAEAPCSGHNNTTVVGVTPTEEIHNETVVLYPGSELSVVVCENNTQVSRENGSWTLEESGAYEIEERDSDVRIRKTATGSVNLTEAVSGVDPVTGPTIESPDETVYDGTGRLLDSQLRLYSISAREQLDDKENAFLETRAAITNTTERLDTFNISADADPQAAADYADILRNLTDVRGDLLNETAAVERILYEQARKNPQPENTTMAMNTLQEKESSVVTQTDQAAAESLATLEAVNSEIQSTVRRNTGLGLLGGLLVGLLAGAVIPWRKGKEVDDFRQMSSKNTLTLGVLTVPWVAGAVLLVAGLAALLVFDILGVVV